MIALWWLFAAIAAVAIVLILRRINAGMRIEIPQHDDDI